MNRILEYVPGYFEGVEPRQAEFSDLASLRGIPWVANRTARPDFYRFSDDGGRLMAEYQNGRLWYVVGFLSGPVEGLPVWRERLSVHHGEERL